jgi:FecR-like protein
MAARTKSKSRGGRRLLVTLLIIIVIVAAGLFYLNILAQAATNAVGVLTVFLPNVSVSHNGGAYAAATTGSVIQPGDSVKTDEKGRAAIQLPDGSVTRLATNTEITLTAAHFSKDGSIHDVGWSEKVGRTLHNVQRLVAGASYKVSGQSAVASVRGTLFEVVVNPDGSMTVKLFNGTLDLIGKNTVRLTAPPGQQAAVDAQGNVGPAGPILPDPNDPFGPEMAASDAVSPGTTPGTEQDYLGQNIHDGEKQTFSYSFAGGGLVKGALGYPGSVMQLTVKSPDGTTTPAPAGKPPLVIVIQNGPAGIYTFTITGVSGLGTNGEEPFLAVAASEPCSTADIDQNGAVRHAYTSQDLSNAIQLNGLSNLSLTIQGDSIAGAIVDGTGSYNQIAWTGTVVLFRHGDALEIIAVGATVFGLNIPAQSIVQQIGGAIGQDPSNINPGFKVDRLFTCHSVVIIDGRHA